MFWALIRPSNRSLLRSGGQWYLVCNEVIVLDRLPVTSLGERLGAELSRYVTGGVDV
jgi:hypothetical protein